MLGTITEYVYDDKNEVIVNTKKNEKPILVGKFEEYVQQKKFGKVINRL